MVMAAKKGPGPGGGVGGSKAEAEAASEVWCRRVRELGGCSQAGNRHCFECAQRGVTYVDITVGSFVCTTCSGLLRGLNPPHRVKSISMTTFTEPEVLFLQSRGNEVCRKIWLGLFDARTSLIPDSRDPQKVKEFLQEKYERKRWYVPPEQAKGSSYSKGSASTPAQGSVPEGKPVRTLLGDPVPSLSDAASSSSQSANQSQTRTAQARSSQPSTKKASTDLLADIGGDPFAAPQVAPAFAAFPAFGGSSQMSAFGVAPLETATQPSSLADVGGLLGPRVAAGGLPGSVFGMPSQVPALQPAVPGVSSSAGFPFGAFTNPFTTPAQPQLPSTNPFQPNGLASGPGFGMSSVGPGLLQPVPPPGAFASPFPAPMFPTQAALTEQQTGSSFGDLGTSKLGQRPLSQAPGVSTNPFMTGASTFASKPPTTNPFL
ncbi:arf-GAP domain and FG repeat-containing protein 2 isoform X3 [Mesocricetus auratus]|uniref:Arf-GAP domain and FG repeat-containing protein 2 isoform X3 n=1 Tax=Mesocricetus auratus TaxID=10036 RepID=A0ABM2W8L2_MESAU|nr:arf-GAP domain and FG repeat-containing protein 2 isoform X3 [Mesocricetus auratus]